MKDEGPAPQLPAGEPAKRSAKAWLAALAVLALSIGVYANALRGGFVNWDDPKLILDNTYVRGITLDNLRHIWTHPIKEAYLPLRATSYALDYTLWGGYDAFGFHLTNLLLHAAVALLVFWVAWRLTRSLAGALAAGAFFAVHPVHTEAVAWASARKDVLSTVLFMLSYALYVVYAQGGRRRLWLVAVSLAAFVLAGLAKAMVVTLPVLVVLTDWVWGERLSKGRWKRLVPVWAAYFAAAGLLGAVAVVFASKAQAIVPYHFGSAARTAFFMTWAALFYLKTLVWPDFLSARYAYGDTASFGVPEIIVRLSPGLLALAVGASLLIYFRARGARSAARPLWLKTIGLGLVWFFVSLLPVMNIISINILVADRYVYLPSVGFALAVGGAFAGAWQRAAGGGRARTIRALMVVVSLAALAALSWRTWERNRVWHDSLSLWTSVTREFPESLEARLLLAGAYAEAEPPQYDEALAETNAAESIAPTSGEVNLVRGRIYARMGERDKAQAEYAMARTLGVKDAGEDYELQLERAASLEAEGDLPGAIDATREAISRDPSRPEGYNNLGHLFERSGDAQQAFDAYRGAVRADPRFAQGWYNMGLLAARNGDTAWAREYYNRSLAIDGESAEALANLAALDLREGDAAAAKPLLEKAVRLKPDLLQARVSLAVAYSMEGDAQAARRQLEAATRIDPGNETVRQMIAKLDEMTKGAK